MQSTKANQMAIVMGFQLIEDYFNENKKTVNKILKKNSSSKTASQFIYDCSNEKQTDF